MARVIGSDRSKVALWMGVQMGVGESGVGIPETKAALDALLIQLPRTVRVAVVCWRYGGDPTQLLADIPRSTWYKARKQLAANGVDLTSPHPSPLSPPPQPPRLTTYCVSVLGAVGTPFHVYCLREKQDLFLSPLGRLAGPKRAELDSRYLAQGLADTCLPRLVRRYGEGVELVVVECGCADTVAARTRMAADSERADAFIRAAERR